MSAVNCCKLSVAVHAENISFNTFVIIQAVASHSTPLSVSAASDLTGQSYWAIRQQVARTPYFTIQRQKPASILALTTDAETKLARIHRRLAAAKP